MKIELTKSQLLSLVDLFEVNFIGIIRHDTELDAIEWVIDLCDAYKTFKKASESEED